MKTTMQNWIALAQEIKEAVNLDKEYRNPRFYIGNTASQSFYFVYFATHSINAVSTILYGTDAIGDRVSIEFRDNPNNPTDFDALFTEAKEWWEGFKTSDHSILIDNQIKSKLNHANQTTQQ